MKRLQFLILTAVLIVGLTGFGVLAQTAVSEDGTWVRWNITAPMACTLSVNAHDGVDMGDLDQIGVTYTASGQGTVVGDRQVVTESNCEYELSVESPNVIAPISTGIVLSRFELGVFGATSPHVTVANPSTWQSFSGLNTQVVLGEAGTPGLGNTVTSTWDMDYAYTTDWDDDNSSAYRVDLQYTASTT